MSKSEEYEKYIPLSESTTYILLALTEPMHGYAIMQYVETITQGCVTIGSGTLYTAFPKLEKEGLIKVVRHEDRRKIYSLTEKGNHVLALQAQRIDLLYQSLKETIKL